MICLENREKYGKKAKLKAHKNASARENVSTL